MSEVRIAKRYAKAALDAAKEKNLIDVFSDDFTLVLSTLKESRELRLLFKSPVVNRNSKTKILEQIFKKRINSKSLNFLKFLIAKGRDSLITEILEMFFQMKNEFFGILEAKVSGFFPMRKNQIENIRKKLESVTLKKVNVNYDVDKELMGGLLIQVGDTVLDGSIRRRIELLKEHLCK